MLSNCYSVIHSNNAYIIIDIEWPNDYIQSIIDSVKPNYIIYENIKVNFYYFIKKELFLHDSNSVLFILLYK